VRVGGCGCCRCRSALLAGGRYCGSFVVGVRGKRGGGEGDERGVFQSVARCTVWVWGEDVSGSERGEG